MVINRKIHIKCKTCFIIIFFSDHHRISEYVILICFYKHATYSVNQREHSQSVEEESIYSSLLDIIQYGAKIAHDEGNINQVHIQKQERFFTSGVKI